MISTVFDGISRHTREGYAFQQRAAEVGFKQAVRERDARRSTTAARQRTRAEPLQ